MNLQFWAGYQEDEITEKTKYWVDLWEEIIEDFSKEAYDKDLINPHLLLMNLIDEIKFNKLKRSRNNFYFLDVLNYFLEKDVVIKKSFNTDFTLIRKDLACQSKRLEYFIILCEQTMESFRNGKYFNESCDCLKEIVLDTQSNDQDNEQMYLLSLNLIIELIILGYSIEKIKTIPESIFSKYKIINRDTGNFVNTKYPTSLNTNDYVKEDSFDKNAYNEDLKAEIDSLSISDRIDKLKFYFDKELSDGYGIFHIEGLKGDVDINVGEVNFYSPKNEDNFKSGKIFEKTYDNFDEMKYDFYDENDPSFVNAAVKIKYRDFESAKKQALESIEKSLDIIRLHILSETPLRVKINKFYLIDCDDLRMSSSFTSDGMKFMKDRNSFDLSKSSLISETNEEYFISLKNFLFSENIAKSHFSSKLIYSLHWYRKAFETNVIEDKLLNYWIVIENLLTFDSKNENIVFKDKNKDKEEKFVLIEELVPFIELSYSLKNVAYETYDYLDNLNLCHQSINPKYDVENSLDIPQECLIKCKLYPRKENIEIDLRDFIQNLNLLTPHVTRKAVKDKIEFAANLYGDNVFMKSEVERRLKQIKQDLLLIYRYRNFIVHNAHFDNNILPYYVMKAENLAGNLLREILYQYSQDSTKTHQQIILQKKVKMERMVEKLNNNLPVDLWKY